MRRKPRDKYTAGSYKVQDDEGPNEPINPPKLKPCRTCAVMTVNYYNCYSCNVRRASGNPDYYGQSEWNELYEQRQIHASAFRRGAL